MTVSASWGGDEEEIPCGPHGGVPDSGEHECMLVLSSLAMTRTLQGDIATRSHVQ